MSEVEDFKIFNKWSCKDVEVKDIALKRYIQLRGGIIPISGGRHEHVRFHKSHVHIVERLANKLMFHGENSGKKLKALKIVHDAFVIIENRTRKNPIQVLVDAVVNCAPREETTRISYGGIVYHTAVDSAPQRRVDLALRYITDAVRKKAFNNVRTIAEILAEELMLAASGNPNSVALRKKQEVERIALSAR